MRYRLVAQTAEHGQAVAVADLQHRRIGAEECGGHPSWPDSRSGRLRGRRPVEPTSMHPVKGHRRVRDGGPAAPLAPRPRRRPVRELPRRQHPGGPTSSPTSSLRPSRSRRRGTLSRNPSRPWQQVDSAPALDRMRVTVWRDPAPHPMTLSATGPPRRLLAVTRPHPPALRPPSSAD